MNEAIAKEAAAFYLVGNGLFEKCINAPQKIGGVATVEDMLAFPMIVNLAFSCELFLKSMIPEEELGPKSGHKLRALYDKQSAEIQQMIKQVVFKKFNESEAWLEAELDKSSDAFYQWRYFYESGFKAVSLSLLQTMSEAFYKLYLMEFT